ncbi:hypothetical protein Slin15195_G129840 [Septoria linicola]|uniref:Uncharacterized protein n=1 Tax=Septoria linicola TaxID=215465 RepID=A0A9Q9B7F6_9PEZI|nr:hypothetical protein Slin14017_G128860 [Septoria linicola]USW59665.1 hypothetical protein Slin15195_G129840 [Septoria linicola]
METMSEDLKHDFTRALNAGVSNGHQEAMIKNDNEKDNIGDMN